MEKESPSNGGDAPIVNGEEQQGEVMRSISLTDAQRSAVERNNDFAFSFYKAVHQWNQRAESAGTVLVIIIPRQYFKDRELIWHDKIERVVFRVVRIS